MSEKDIMASTSAPRTGATLERDLRALGLRAGEVLLVHSSLKSLGWVVGGVQTVIETLMKILGSEGTLMMPSHSTQLSDPAGWIDPPAPESWHSTIRGALPAYDPATTPTRGMGAIAELFRTFTGVRRSTHPHVSFSAWGRRRDELVSFHPFNWSLGPDSPLGRLDEVGGRILLLGVGWDVCTGFHLAEYELPEREEVLIGVPVRNPERTWIEYRDIEFHDERFEALGAAFERTGRVNLGTVGSASARLFDFRTALDFARKWLTEPPDSR